MKVYPLDRFLKFSPEAHTKHVFFESEKLKAQVVGLESGQRIPPCRMEQDVIFFVIEGEGKIIVDGEERRLKKSSWVYVPKERKSRSIQAEARMAILAIQIRS